MVNYIIAAALVLASVVSHAMEDKPDSSKSLSIHSHVVIIFEDQNEQIGKIRLAQRDMIIEEVHQDAIAEICYLMGENENCGDTLCGPAKPGIYFAKFSKIIEEKGRPITSLNLSEFCENVGDEILTFIKEKCSDLKTVTFCPFFDNDRATQFLLKLGNGTIRLVPCQIHNPY